MPEIFGVVAVLGRLLITVLKRRGETRPGERLRVYVQTRTTVVDVTYERDATPPPR
jgi:hypothetical protein